MNESSSSQPIRFFPPAKPGSKVLLVEGGGMKGAFAGGALTVLNEHFDASHFDMILAVSSGACSAAYYASTPSSEPERGEHLLNIWRWELSGHRLISPFNPFRGKQLLDQKFLVDKLFRKKYPIWTEYFNKQGLPPLYVAVTNLKKKSLEYILATGENIFDLLKAATSLPIATKGRHRIGKEMFCDAAILNPLPLEDLINAGYKDITVVMNSPVWWESLPLARFTRFLSFPFNRKISKLMKKWHHHHFNNARNIALNPPRGVEIRVISPDEILPVGLVTTKRSLLEEIVELGKAAALKILPELKKSFSFKEIFQKGTVKNTKKTAKKKFSKKKNATKIAGKKKVGTDKSTPNRSTQKKSIQSKFSQKKSIPKKSVNKKTKVK